MEREELRELLERLYDRYDRPEFIENDPVSVPHLFSSPVDIEISAFLVSTIAWGNRKAIVAGGRRMMACMDGRPYDFVRYASGKELTCLQGFVYRTFNGEDFVDFALSLRGIYRKWGTLGDFFSWAYHEGEGMCGALSAFRREFFARPHGRHCEKHVSSIDRGAACKRLNMFLRWMVRHDERGVDFGLWEDVPTSALFLPLDTHTGNMSRALGLLERRQNDWRAVEEVTAALRDFDADDPVRFDYALFGAGIDGFLR